MGQRGTDLPLGYVHGTAWDGGTSASPLMGRSPAHLFRPLAPLLNLQSSSNVSLAPKFLIFIIIIIYLIYIIIKLKLYT